MAKKINTYYWQQHDVKVRQILLNGYIDKTEQEIIQQYLKVSKKIEDELTNLYARLSVNGPVRISDLYSYERYYQAMVNVDKMLNKLTAKQTNILTKNLTDLYKDVQNVIAKEYNVSFITNKNAIYEAVTQVWVDDGLTFAQRIKTHGKQLQQRLEETLVEAVQTGASTEKLAKQLSNATGIGINESRRLVRTELAHVENKAAVDSYRKAGITQYRWLTAKGCCDECNERNGEVININSGDLPPGHPNCRCTITAVIDWNTFN